MKKSTKKLISLISAGLIVLQSIPFMAMGSFAADAGDNEALKYTPTLDGVKDEAYNASYSYTEAMSVGDWTFSFLYDESYIYVYADIKDSSKSSLMTIAMSMHETIEGNWQAFQKEGASLCYLVSNPFLTGYEIRHRDNPAGGAGWKNIGSNLGWQNTPANGVEGEYVKEGTTSPATEYGLVVTDAGCALEFRVAYNDIDSTGKVSFAVADNVGGTNAYGQLWGADNIAVDNAAFMLGAEYDTTHNHTYEEAWTVDVAPTCLAAGSESRHCVDYATCGGYTDQQVVPATGHIFVDGVCSCGVLETALALKYTPKLDGNLESAWFETYSYALDTSVAKGLWNTDETEAYTATGSVVSGTAYYLYDDGYIYIAADIKDSTLAAMADNWQALNDGNNLQWADTVVFSIYNNANIQGEAVGITVGPMNDYAYAPNKNGTGMGSNWESTWTKATDTNNSEYAVSTYEGGYIVELRIAATTLTEGTTYGIDLGVWDGVDHTINQYGGITSVWSLGTLWTGSRLGTFVLSGEEYVDTHEHTWTDTWETVKDPTCTDTGLKINKCVDYDTCFGTQEEEIAALGHTWATEKAVDVAATCTTAGSESIHCTVCGESDTETATEIAALGHAWNTVATVDRAATCLLAQIESIHCGRCNVIDEDTVTTTTSAFGHSYVDGVCSTCAAAEATHTVFKGTPVLDGEFDDAYIGTATITTLDLIEAGKIKTSWNALTEGDAVYTAWTTAGIPTAGETVLPADADYSIAEFAKAESYFLWDDDALYIYTKVYDDDIQVYENVGTYNPWLDDVLTHQLSIEQNIGANINIYTIPGVQYIYDNQSGAWTAITRNTGDDAAQYMAGTVNAEEGYYTVEVKIPVAGNYSGDDLNTLFLQDGHTFSYGTVLTDGYNGFQGDGTDSNNWAQIATTAPVVLGLSEIAAHEHTWNEEYTVDVEATCYSEGSKSIHCSICGNSDASTVTVIEMLDHATVSEYDETGDMYTIYCENDGCEEYHEYIGEVTVEATCGDGEKVYTCYACSEAPHINESLTETLWGTGEHTFEGDTCSVCGYTRVLGAWDYPYELTIGGTVLAVTVAPGETAYVQASEVDGAIVTIGEATSANYAIYYGRMPVTLADDGTGTFTLDGWYQFTINNNSETETIVVYLKLEEGAPVDTEGTMDDPKVIDLGTHSVDLAAGNSGYYYQYTATADGNVVFTMDTADAWFYVINIAKADGSYVYGDNQWSDSDPVAATQTLALAAGDVVTINVATYDANNMWTNPEGTITITLAEEVVEDPCADGHTLGATSGGVKTCSVCGYVSNLRVGSANIDLGADITLNIKIRKDVFDGAGYTNPYVEVVRNGETLNLVDYTVDGNYYVFPYKNWAPYQMGDVFTAVVHGTLDGADVAGEEVFSYSVKQYVENQFTKYPDDAAFRTLLVDLLVYGYQHQRYNEYNLDAPLTTSDVITAADIEEYATAELHKTLENNRVVDYATVENPVAVWKAASVVLQSTIEMQLKFEAADTTGISVVFADADGNVIDTVTEFTTDTNGRYVAQTAKLTAVQLYDLVYVTAYKDGVAISNTVQYSIESYAASKLTDATVGELCIAMMKYGHSAEQYLFG